MDTTQPPQDLPDEGKHHHDATDLFCVGGSSPPGVDPIITADQIADHLGCGVKYARSVARQAGLLPYHRRHTVRVADYNQWLRSQRVVVAEAEATTEPASTGRPAGELSRDWWKAASDE